MVSEVSLLEIAIKQKIGRLPNLTLSIDDLTTQLLADGFTLLPIERRHISTYERIPLFADHRDPFDRLLLATALSDNLMIISADEKFLLYKDMIRLVAV
jgi:PIN domain nuclease of toxin-antitoxin system